MNVLTYVHLRNIGPSTGVGRVARNCIEELAARPDIQLKILGDRGDQRSLLERVGLPWTEFDYRLFSLSTTWQQARWCVLDAPKAERYWDEANIVYCTGESYVPTRRAALVVTLHDASRLEADDSAYTRATASDRGKWWLLYKRISDHADAVITVSAHAAERLTSCLPALKGRVHVVPNAAAELFLQEPSEESFEKLHEKGYFERSYVFVPGGLSERKNAELILRAWPIFAKRNPNVRLIVGSFSDDRFETRMRSLSSSAIFAGFLPDDQLNCLYRRAKVVWFPSRYEGFGMPILEAMACGVPVVASRATAVPEVAGNAALLGDTDGVEEHVELLTRVLNAPGLRENLVAKGRARALDFRWSRSVEKLVDVFRHVRR